MVFEVNWLRACLRDLRCSHLEIVLNSCCYLRFSLLRVIWVCLMLSSYSVIADLSSSFSRSQGALYNNFWFYE
jgi:hypothetical protein